MAYEFRQLFEYFYRHYQTELVGKKPTHAKFYFIFLGEDHPGFKNLDGLTLE